MSDTVRFSSSLLLSGGYGVDLRRVTTYTDEEREKRKESLKDCIERIGGIVHAINDTNIRDLIVVEMSLPRSIADKKIMIDGSMINPFVHMEHLLAVNIKVLGAKK